MKSQMRARWVTKLFALMFLLLLPACGAYNTASPNISFSDDEEKGIVVISYRANAHRLSTIALNWREYDPEVGFFKDVEGSGFPMSRVSTHWGVETRSPLQDVRYVAYEMKPGYYALHTMTLRYARMVLDIKPRPSTLVFRVNNKEILYLGNLLLDVPKTVRDTLLVKDFATYNYRATKLSADGRDDEAAKAFLAENYTKLDGPFVFRAPQRTVLNLQ